MKRTLFVSNVSFRSRALLVLLLAFAPVAVGCDSGDDGRENESLTISPDVLDLDVVLSQDDEEADVYVLVNGTNTSNRTINSGSVSVRLWNASSQIVSRTFGITGLPPNTSTSDNTIILEVDNLSEIECYTYRVSVEPLLGNGDPGTTSAKVYPGSCPEDHPANG